MILQAKWFWFLAGLIPWVLTLVCAIVLALNGTGWFFYLIIGLLVLCVSRLVVSQLGYLYGPEEMREQGVSPIDRLAMWRPWNKTGLPAVRRSDSAGPKFPILDDGNREKLLAAIPRNHRVRVFCHGRYFYDLFTDINHFLYSRGYSVEGEVNFSSDGLVTPDTSIVVGRDCTSIYLNSAKQGNLKLVK